MFPAIAGEYENFISRDTPVQNRIHQGQCVLNTQVMASGPLSSLTFQKLVPTSTAYPKLKKRDRANVNSKSKTFYAIKQPMVKAPIFVHIYKDLLCHRRRPNTLSPADRHKVIIAKTTATWSVCVCVCAKCCSYIQNMHEHLYTVAYEHCKQRSRQHDIRWKKPPNPNISLWRPCIYCQIFANIETRRSRNIWLVCSIERLKSWYIVRLTVFQTDTDTCREIRQVCWTGPRWKPLQWQAETFKIYPPW